MIFNQKGEKTIKVKIGLRQSIGKPSLPCVKVSDTVKTGQKIAVINEMGCNIHASIDGTVTEVTDEYIVIEGEKSDDFLKIDDSLSVIDKIKEAGVVGSGGAGFPTHLKLSTKISGGTLYINSAECEPLLLHNIDYVENNVDDFLKGIEIVSELLECDKAVIAIKKKHDTTIELLKKNIKNSKIEIGLLDNIYPAGDERVIIRELHGVVLEPGALPLTVNAVVLNVETVKNIFEAVVHGKPVITKDLTFGGRIKDLYEPKVLRNQPIGSIVEEIINQNGEILEPYGEILMGGPFTGKAVEFNDSVNKTTGGIFVTNPFLEMNEKFGIIECECGATPDRLKYLVEQMNGTIVATEKCKRMVEVNGRFRCEKPGECPGQAEVCLKLKKAGATTILATTCED